MVVDGLSRSKPLSSEWSLDAVSFQWKCERTFVPEIDLFATRENHRIKPFISPVPDSEAFAIDAFAIDWNQWRKIYAFPPTSQILKVLTLLQGFKGEAIVVTPDWPNQPWYPVLMSRAVEHFLIPHPLLYQIVGRNTIWASSKVWLHLHLWII